jgi:carboxymethylenebutenolidase
MSRTVTVSSGADQLPLLDVEPTRTPRGGVIVLQDAFGVNGYIEDVSQWLAEQGYRAVAPHLFHRSGDPELPYGPAETVMPYVAQLTEQGLLDDLDACVRYFADAGIDEAHTAIVGFCLGGSISLRGAVAHPFGAAVTYYGGGIKEGRLGMEPLAVLATHLQSPWLGLYGDQDVLTPVSHGIPIEEVEELREAAASSGLPTEVVRYPDAGHAFHCHPRATYHEPSAKDAWQRTLGWLDDHLPA